MNRVKPNMNRVKSDMNRIKPDMKVNQLLAYLKTSSEKKETGNLLTLFASNL